MNIIQAVKGEVFIDGISRPVCMRPVLDGNYFAISNFRRFRGDFVYSDQGPHVRLTVLDLDFVSLMSMGTDVIFPQPFAGKPVWHGEVVMLKGRSACDEPDGQRNLEELSLRVVRLVEATRFEFKAIAGKRSDAGDWPATLDVAFWFEVPDSEVDTFIVGAEANSLYRQCLTSTTT